MAEWLKAHAWKACKRETVSRVRIPLSPPFFKDLAQPKIYNKIIWSSYGRQHMKKFIGILLLVIFWSGNAHSIWIKMGNSEEVTIYYHPESLIDKGKIKHVWALIDQKEKAVDGLDSFSSKTLLAIDCINRRYKREQSVFYKKNMGKGKIVAETSDKTKLGGWKNTIPDSLISPIVKKVCY